MISRPRRRTPSSTPTVAAALARAPRPAAALIDLAVPRDIDPRVGAIEGGALHDLDDLRGVVSRNPRPAPPRGRRGRGDRRGQADEFVAGSRRATSCPRSACCATTPRTSARPRGRALSRAAGISTPRSACAWSGSTARSCGKLLHQPTGRCGPARVDATGSTSPTAVHELFGLADTWPDGPLRLGTRGSRLALAQAGLAADGLRAAGRARWRSCRSRRSATATGAAVRRARRPRDLHAGDRGGAAGRPRRRRRALGQGPHQRGGPGPGARGRAAARRRARRLVRRARRSGGGAGRAAASARPRCGAAPSCCALRPDLRVEPCAATSTRACASASSEGSTPSCWRPAASTGSGWRPRSASGCPAEMLPEVGQGFVALQTPRGEEALAAALDDADACARCGRARRRGPRSAAAARRPSPRTPPARAAAGCGLGRPSPTAARRWPRRAAARSRWRWRRRSPRAAAAGGAAARGGARVTVYLVGAGPGDPGLITARGARAAARAPRCAATTGWRARALLGRGAARLPAVDAGKAPGRPAMTQEEIDAALVEQGRAGRAVVVRLKGGDPFVFGRGSEEAVALRAAGVPFEVVPGITSAIAVPAYAGMPVTQRGAATRFTVVTGHEDPSKGDVRRRLGRARARPAARSSSSWASGGSGEIADAWSPAGATPRTPCAVVRDGTLGSRRPSPARWPRSPTDAAHVRPPAAVVVVGDVVGAARRDRVGRAAAAARRDRRRDARARPGPRAGGPPGASSAPG